MADSGRIEENKRKEWSLLGKCNVPSDKCSTFSAVTGGCNAKTYKAALVADVVQSVPFIGDVFVARDIGRRKLCGEKVRMYEYGDFAIGLIPGVGDVIAALLPRNIFNVHIYSDDKKWMK